ncbi:MAG: NADH-quinone oxidoreductase subunit NuoE [Alphaproteobacteria bacterium]|nr:NADH-quinone oxidoreductase subunit NuoE [Alphaproteobacteria bacterium]
MSRETVANALKEFGVEREKLIAVMQYVVSKEKWLSEESMKLIASAFNISAAEVYGVASFYSFLDTEPRGKYVIRICRTISCSMDGKDTVLEALQKALGIKTGETTPDNKFTLLETNCIGWCDKGPAMLVNEDVHTYLTPEKVVEIINDYRAR